MRSPVGNVYSMSDEDAAACFQENVVDAFCEMYGIDINVTGRLKEPGDDTFLKTFKGGVLGALGQEIANIDEIKAGIQELKVRTMP